MKRGKFQTYVDVGGARVPSQRCTCTRSTNETCIERIKHLRCSNNSIDHYPTPQPPLPPIDLPLCFVLFFEIAGRHHVILKVFEMFNNFHHYVEEHLNVRTQGNFVT